MKYFLQFEGKEKLLIKIIIVVQILITILLSSLLFIEYNRPIDIYFEDEQLEELCPRD